MKKKKVKKQVPISLSPYQIGHLIRGSVKNLVDLDTHVWEGGVKFLLILECIVEEECIPANQEPNSDEEIFDIMSAHTILELSDFFEAILSIKRENKYYRGFSTIDIDQDNVGEFINSLSELEEYWAEIDKEIEEEQDLKSKTEGKNYVDGNGTLN